MPTVSDQPDAQRGAGRPDPDVEPSGWLAAALYGQGVPEGGRSHADPAHDDAQPPGVPTPGVPTPDAPAADTAAQPSPPNEALSPLGAPPMPPTPTGAVRWWIAGTTLAAAGLLTLGAYAGPGIFVAAALLVVAVMAWGWSPLANLPSPRGSTAVVALGGAACVVAVGLTQDEPLLQWLALALAGTVVLEFVHQLVRRDGRPRLVECVTGTLAGIVVLASMSAWLALPRTPVGAGGVLLVAVPVAVGLALEALPFPGRLTSLAGVVATVLLSGLLAGFVPEPTVGTGLLSGLLAGAVAVMLHRLLSVLPPAGSAPAWLAVALAPLASSGMVGYVVLRLMVG